MRVGKGFEDGMDDVTRGDTVGGDAANVIGHALFQVGDGRGRNGGKTEFVEAGTNNFRNYVDVFHTTP